MEATIARDGSGTFTLAEAAFVTGTTIDADDMNSDLSDIATGLTASIAKDGQTTPTADLPMGGFKHTNVDDAAARTQYARADQVQDSTLTHVLTTGTDTILATLTPAITAYVVGQTFHLKKSAAANTDAVTLNVNSVGAGAVQWPDGTALAASELPANCTFTVMVQATTPVFQLQSCTIAPRLLSGLLTTRGDIIRRGASAPERVALGATGRALVSDGTDAVYGFPNLAPITASLGGDVALNNTANYFTGPSIPQGSTGVWFVFGTVTLVDTAGAGGFYAKLWDGTTVIASGAATPQTANENTTISLSGYISAPAGDLRISCRDTVSTSGAIKYDVTGNAKDSTITAIRIG